MDIGGIGSSQATARVHGPGGGHAMRAKVESAVADTLGLSVDDLRTQLRSGKSMTQVAAAQGVSKDDLVSAIATALRSSSTSASSASSGGSQAADVTARATRIADRVGSGRPPGRPGGPPPGGPTPNSTVSSSTDLAALLQAAGLKGSDADGDKDASTFSVKL